VLCLAAATALAIPALAQTDVTPQGHFRRPFPADHQPSNPATQSATPAPGQPTSAVTPAKPSAASTLPPTPPTVAAPAPPAAPVIPPTPDHVPAKPATIAYSHGRITVQADNSSLNSILGLLMRDTGMQVSGGVTDSRVYGTYGPAPLQSILITLLQGTGTNMIFTPGSQLRPPQLTLTAREGGATPPPPTVAPPDHPSPPPPAPAPVVAATPAPVQPAAAAAPAPTPAPAAATPSPAPQLANTPAAAPATASPAQSAAAPAAATNPNHVKSPEEILQEILQMRQQRNAAPAPSSPAAPSPNATSAPASTPATH